MKKPPGGSEESVVQSAGKAKGRDSLGRLCVRKRERFERLGETGRFLPQGDSPERILLRGKQKPRTKSSSRE